MGVYIAFYTVHIAVFTSFRYDLYKWAYLELENFDDQTLVEEVLYDYCCYKYTAFDSITG